MAIRQAPGYSDPNSPDYGEQPQADPGHTHTKSSVSNPSAAATSPSVVSGTPFQCSTTSDATLYIAINTAAALAIAVGPTNAVATPILASETAALSVITLRVPVGWWVKITGTIADLKITQISG